MDPCYRRLQNLRGPFGSPAICPVAARLSMTGVAAVMRDVTGTARFCRFPRFCVCTCPAPYQRCSAPLPARGRGDGLPEGGCVVQTEIRGPIETPFKISACVCHIPKTKNNSVFMECIPTQNLFQSKTGCGGIPRSRTLC